MDIDSKREITKRKKNAKLKEMIARKKKINTWKYMVMFFHLGKIHGNFHEAYVAFN